MLVFKRSGKLEDWVERSTKDSSVDFSDSSLFSVASFEVSRSDNDLFTNCPVKCLSSWNVVDFN
jgi:hypothetical protein